MRLWDLRKMCSASDWEALPDRHYGLGTGWDYRFVCSLNAGQRIVSETNVCSWPTIGMGDIVNRDTTLIQRTVVSWLTEVTMFSGRSFDVISVLMRRLGEVICTLVHQMEESM